MPTEPSISKDKEFSRIRALLWPIHSYELKKLLPLIIMFACIAFSYSALRSTKDSGVMEDASGAFSATGIPLLKVVLVLPSAIFGKNLYNFLRHRFSEQTTFYSLICGFMCFFPIYSFIMHPPFEAHRSREQTTAVMHVNSESRSLTGNELWEAHQKVIQENEKNGPKGAKKLLKGLIHALTVNLDNTIFYVMSELWGSIALSLLFWGLCNTICKISETSRFYPILGFGANIATSFVSWFNPLVAKFFKVYTGLEHQNAPAVYDIFFLKSLSILVFVMGLITIGCYYYLQTEVLPDPRFYVPPKPVKKKAKSQGLIAGLKYIFNDPYLRNICFSVVAYGILAQMVEYISKEQLNIHYRHVRGAEMFKSFKDFRKAIKHDINHFNARITGWGGLIAAFMGLIGAGNIIREMGWTFSALVTPIIMLVTGFFALGSAAFPTIVGNLLPGIKPYTLGMWLGAFQTALSKGTKYTLFDSTKEMTYVPLDPETKNRAKAEIDVVGARFGKAGGALYNSSLLALLGGSSALVVAPVSFVALLGFGTYWCFSTVNLGVQFNQKLQMRQKEEEISLKRA